ncbi:hypothetical protein N6H14_05070 [Paenibacillus sp. CC-CFT747]|nr:hypothetical protein N6H14_05070 [Paenibacillus sp. CC-CFT747]
MQQNKGRSIFRKNVGRCFLNHANDPYLQIWELDLTTRESKARNGHFVDGVYQQHIESKVSEYIQSSFSFALLEMAEKEERLYLESRLISTVSCCTECGPSGSWLGLSSPVQKIKQSGMWQVNELYKEPLSVEETRGLAGYP